MIGKPGSVVDDHLSRLRIAPKFKRINRPADEQSPPKWQKQISLQPTGFTSSVCHHTSL